MKHSGNAIWYALLATACCGMSIAWSQESSKLTARELFYTPIKAAKPAPTAVSKPAKAKSPAPVETASERPEPVKAPSAEPSAPVTPSGVPVVATSETSYGPLGLRYSFLKYDSPSHFEEVDADSVFHSGDRMRIRLEANEAAYLYMVMQGTSGTWRVMFPSTEYDNGDNRVRAGTVYDLPRNTRFAFTGKPGTERIFLVLSRQPVADLDELIYTLQGDRAQPEDKNTSQPEASPPPPRQMLASLRPLDDELVGRLRNAVYARDLVFEKVDDSTPGERKEKAVYVVNKSTAPDARLIADIRLRHE